MPFSLVTFVTKVVKVTTFNVKKNNGKNRTVLWSKRERCQISELFQL